MTCLSAPQNLTNLQCLAIEELNRCLKLAEDYFGREFVLDHVAFNLRGRSAGQFRAKQLGSTGLFGKAIRVKEIRLNAALLAQYGEEFIRDTVGHEVAHFIVFELYAKRVRPHGKEWQAVMTEVLQQAPTVTHQYQTEPARKLMRYRYLCACEARVHELTAIRHKKILDKQAQYHCKDCRSEIFYES